MEINKKQKFIPCECDTHGILLTKFIDENVEENEIYLSIFSSGQYNKKPTIGQRLKFMWYHLKTGKYYDDEIVLSSKKANVLASWLIKYSK